MTIRTLLIGTALTSTLLSAATLSAMATPVIPLSAYPGAIDIVFSNYESFLTSSGSVVSAPAPSEQNFGVFNVLDITPKGGSTALWSPGTDGKVLVGVFDGIKVATTGVSGTTQSTTNTGGVFQLYEVDQSQFAGAGGFHQGTGGYAAAGCAIGSLCYNGVTNMSSSQLVLTVDLVPGIDPSDPTATLTATLDIDTLIGSAGFDGTLSGPAASEFGPDVTAKDSFCPNGLVHGDAGCQGANNSSFDLASEDPIDATTAVPEPASLALFGAGLLGLGFFSWRRRKSA